MNSSFEPAAVLQRLRGSSGSIDTATRLATPGRALSPSTPASLLTDTHTGGLHAENASLRRQLADAQMQNRELREALDATNEAEAQYNGQASALERKLEAALEKVSALERQHLRAKEAEADKAAAAESGQRRHVAKLEASIQDLEAAVLEAQTTTARVRKERDSLQFELESVEATLARERRRHTSEIADLTARLQHLERQAAQPPAVRPATVTMEVDEPRHAARHRPAHDHRVHRPAQRPIAIDRRPVFAPGVSPNTKRYSHSPEKGKLVLPPKTAEGTIARPVLTIDLMADYELGDVPDGSLEWGR